MSKQLAQCEETFTESVFWMRITDSSFKLKKQEMLFILLSCQTRVTTLCLYTTTNQCSVSPPDSNRFDIFFNYRLGGYRPLRDSLGSRGLSSEVRPLTPERTGSE